VARARASLLHAKELRQGNREAPFNLAITFVNLAECERLLAEPYKSLGYLEQARQTVRAAYARVEQELSLPPHILLGKIENELGTLKTVDLGDPEGGVAALQEALRIYSLNGLTTFNYDTMITTFNLGVALQRARRYAEAQHHVRLAAAACRTILPPESAVRQAIEQDEEDLRYSRH
jgi:tetratricopeptide (TPR) repeat protein